MARWLSFRPTGWIVVAVAIAVYSGARMGEIRELRRKDVDLDRGVILVRRAMSASEVSTPKSKKGRVVRLHPALRALLEPRLKLMLPEALVIVNASGQRPSRQAVLTSFQRLCHRAGTRAWSFHSLRHWAITALLRRGAPAIAVQQMAGHSSLAVTQGYVHAVADDLADAMSRLPTV